MTQPAEAQQETESTQESTEKPESSGPVLQIQGLTVKAGSKTLLKDLSLDLPARGVFALMGPGGAGKSTLLGILSGGIPGLDQTGEITYLGAPLTNSHRPLVLGQKVQNGTGTLIEELLSKPGPYTNRDYLHAADLLREGGLDRLRSSLDKAIPSLTLSASQSWRLAILRAIAQDPRLLCVDEPTAAMDEEEARPILNLLSAQSTQRGILFVTHNQEHARHIAHSVALMAAARLHGILPVAEFFGESASPLIREYVRTGGCHVPSPDAPIDHIDPDYLTPPQPLPSQISEPAPVQIAPPSHVLWETDQPVLDLKDFGLTMGERSRLLQVNLQLGKRGAYQLVCLDGTIRRLLHAFLSTGLQGKVTVTGEYTLLGHRLDEDHHAATIELGVKLLMNSVREYLLSGYPQRMSLGSIDEKHTWIEQHLTEQNALDLSTNLGTQVLDLSSEQKRRLAIARAAASSPAVLVLDEPLQGLDAESAAKVLQAITEESARRAVLVLAQEAIPQWKDMAKFGYIYGEYLYPQPPSVKSETPQPVAAPTTSLVVEAERTDRAVAGDSRPAEETEPRSASIVSVAEEQPQSPAERVVASEPEERYTAPRQYGQGPRGFHWLIPGVLAGTPEPGMMHDLEYDLSLLHSAGITLLVTLTETPLDDETLAAQGIKSLFFPIVDMHAPSVRAAFDLCGLIDLQLQRGEHIAFHCKAGLGRTGTLLCSYLIWKGDSAHRALDRARKVEPAWVQSREQERFLVDFESFCRAQKQNT